MALIQDTEDREQIPIDALVARVIGAVEQMASTVDVEACLRPWAPYPPYITGIELTDLFASGPGQGAGSKVMRFICEAVNEVRLPLYLRPDGDRSREFYARFGLVKADRLHGFMVLYPLVEDDDESGVELMQKQRG